MTEELSFFCALNELTGNDEILATNSFTVFAPTDDAFAALPVDIFPSETGESDPLEYLLQYHAISTEIRTTDLICEGGVLDNLTMANGEDTIISCSSSIDDASTFIAGNGNALPGPKIISKNIAACNGIVHVINGVLRPGTTEEPTPTPTLFSCLPRFTTGCTSQELSSCCSPSICRVLGDGISACLNPDDSDLFFPS